MFSLQSEKSVLFITLDSCRYDTFEAAQAPNLKAVGQLHRAMAPGNFTYASHAAMFVGFTPGIATRKEAFVNPKYGKIFKLVNGGFHGKGTEYFTLTGHNIIEGFKRLGYLTIGSGAAGWFDTNTETGSQLTRDFDQFYYPGNTISLNKQLTWLEKQLMGISRPVLVFLNVGETHVPYYYEGAAWDFEDNPCIPFADTNNATKCRVRQTACLEYVDRQLAPLLQAFSNSTIVICSDHGDCWGEDGLWEHGISHPKVLEVPLLFRLAELSRVIEAI